MMMFIKISIGAGFLIGIIGVLLKKEFLRHAGYMIAWFALLCGTYQNPMFGTGIAPDADFDGIIRSINPGLIVSVLIPLVAIGYHLYGIYRVMFIKKVNNNEPSDKDSKE